MDEDLNRIEDSEDSDDEDDLETTVTPTKNTHDSGRSRDR